MSLKTTIKDKSVGRTSRVYKTSDSAMAGTKGFQWWLEKDAGARSRQLFATVAYLKQAQQFRQRQAAQFARLYGGHSLYSFVGSNLSKMDQISTLAPNRPTFNLISSVVDTLVSRLTQSRPTPVFLTDNGDYKERNLAKKLNDFIQGEFYRTKAYEIGEFILTDALVQGTGVLKILETMDKKVGIERVLLTELFVDIQEAAFGDPRRMYQVKLMDRTVLESAFPKHRAKAENAEKATIDSSAQTAQSVADLVMVVEGWALPSGEDTDDGWHSIVCSEGELFSEKWTKQKFPFVFLHHKKRQLGFWSQGTAENLLGTQLELNSLLDTISKSIKLVGVPRIFMEEGSKVNKAAFSNKIGMIVPYRGTPPVFAVSQSNAPELYEERARLIQFGFEQEGLSMLSATSQKPAGLNSGEAQRVYQDINSDRFAALERRYTNFYVDLAYQVIDKAIDISEREGTYKTVFVDKRKGTKEIELPDMDALKDPFVIQAFVQSSLPKEPAGRLQKITEMIQSNMVTIQEGRRLLDFPDLGQIETLANASEERIFAQLDEIVENANYEGPDQWTNLEKATEIVTQYINLYSTCKLEEEKMQMLRDYFTAIQDVKMAMMPPMPPQMPMGGGIENQLALPQPLPQSPLLPQGGPGGGGIPMMAEGGLVEDQKKNPEITPEEKSMFQKFREGAQGAMETARTTLNEIPGLDLAIKAFQYTSPAGYAFSQAGEPKPEGGVLEQISHVPGAQVAADIPIGWKVLKGSGQGIEKKLETLKDAHKTVIDEIIKLESQDATKNKKQILALWEDATNIKSQMQEAASELSKKPALDIVPDQKTIKQQTLDDLYGYYRAEKNQERLKNTPLDEAAKKVIEDAKLDLQDDLKYWISVKKNPEDKAVAIKRIKQKQEQLKNLEQITVSDVEEKMLEQAKRSEETKKFMSEMNELRAAEKAAEEERLKNVVVPIEIEGGPLKKSNPKDRYEIVKKGDTYWVKDKFLNEKITGSKTKKEAQENLNYFAEKDLIKTGPQGIVREQQRRSDLNPEITGKNVKKTLPKITKSELNSYVDEQLSQQESTDVDQLFEAITENLFDSGMSVDRDELYRMLKSKVDPRKKD